MTARLGTRLRPVDSVRRSLLDEYRSSLAEIETALKGLSPSDLNHRPSAGEWTPREIVHHLADTEVLAGGRLRLILSRNQAPVARFDENELAEVSSPGSRPMDKSLSLLRAHIDATADLLEAVGEADWKRFGVQEDGTAYAVEGWLERRINHAREHADQIRRTRSR